MSIAITCYCRFLKPLEGFGVVLLRSVAEVIQFSDVIPHIGLHFACGGLEGQKAFQRSCIVFLCFGDILLTELSSLIHLRYVVYGRDISFVRLLLKQSERVFVISVIH